MTEGLIELLGSDIKPRGELQTLGLQLVQAMGCNDPLTDSIGQLLLHTKVMAKEAKLPVNELHLLDKDTETHAKLRKEYYTVPRLALLAKGILTKDIKMIFFAVSILAESRHLDLEACLSIAQGELND